MSLPPILKHVYNHGTEEVIRRGKKIFHTAGVQMLDVDHLIEQVRFRVRNDLYQNYYTVTVTKYLSPKELGIRCQCPYNLGDICRHEVAALFQLNDIIQSGFFENTDITYHQQHTVVRMRQVSMQMLRVFTSTAVIDKAEAWASMNKAIIVSDKTDQILAEVPDEEHTYRVTIKQNEDRYFDTSCGCDETSHPLCIHKSTLFIQLLKANGTEYFQTMRDWDEQKNKLLKQYGYSLKDDLTNKFSFVYQNGKPFLRVLDPTLKKIAPVETYRPNIEKAVAAPTATIAAPEKEVAAKKRLGVVIDPNTKWYPFTGIQLVGGHENEDGTNFTGAIERIELQQYINPLLYKEEDRDLLPVARKFSGDELVKYLRKNLPFGDFLDNTVAIIGDNPAEEMREQVWEYLLPKYQKLMNRYSSHAYCFMQKRGKQLSSANIEPVAFAQKQIHPQLSVAKSGDDYTISLDCVLIPCMCLMPIPPLSMLHLCCTILHYTL
jgi:hypothetical protein